MTCNLCNGAASIWDWCWHQSYILGDTASRGACPGTGCGMRRCSIVLLISAILYTSVSLAVQSSEE